MRCFSSCLLTRRRKRRACLDLGGVLELSGSVDSLSTPHRQSPRQSPFADLLLFLFLPLFLSSHPHSPSSSRPTRRLNKKLYHPAHFTDRGIEHVEMYFDDGTNPTMEIVREFIDLSDRVIMGGGALRFLSCLSARSLRSHV